VDGGRGSQRGVKLGRVGLSFLSSIILFSSSWTECVCRVYIITTTTTAAAAAAAAFLPTTTA
jgi:hypothetical protein